MQGCRLQDGVGASLCTAGNLGRPEKQHLLTLNRPAFLTASYASVPSYRNRWAGREWSQASQARDHIRRAPKFRRTFCQQGFSRRASSSHSVSSLRTLPTAEGRAGCSIAWAHAHWKQARVVAVDDVIDIVLLQGSEALSRASRKRSTSPHGRRGAPRRARS